MGVEEAREGGEAVHHASSNLGWRGDPNGVPADSDPFIEAFQQIGQQRSQPGMTKIWRVPPRWSPGRGPGYRRQFDHERSDQINDILSGL
jgi:hypothetical protein